MNLVFVSSICNVYRRLMMEFLSSVFKREEGQNDSIFSSSPEQQIKFSWIQFNIFLPFFFMILLPSSSSSSLCLSVFIMVWASSLGGLVSLQPPKWSSACSVPPRCAGWSAEAGQRGPLWLSSLSEFCFLAPCGPAGLVCRFWFANTKVLPDPAGCCQTFYFHCHWFNIKLLFCIFNIHYFSCFFIL